MLVPKNAERWVRAGSIQDAHLESLDRDLWVITSFTERVGTLQEDFEGHPCRQDLYWS